MLHVHRRPDVDAGVEQLLDVLPALGVARAGHVRVRELVDEDQPRLARERGVEIELLQRRGRGSRPPSAAGARGRRAAPRFRRGHGFRSRRSTTSTPCCFQRCARRQHRVGLADAGRGAEEDLQLAALACASSSFSRPSSWSGSGRLFGHRLVMVTITWSPPCAGMRAPPSAAIQKLRPAGPGAEAATSAPKASSHRQDRDRLAFIAFVSGMRTARVRPGTWRR